MRKLVNLASMILSISMLVACGNNGAAQTPPTNQPQPESTATTMPATATIPARPTELPPTAYPAPAATTAPEATKAPAAQPTAYPAPGANPTPAAINAPDDLVAAAQERLAKHLGRNTKEFTIQSGASKQWPDTSLGCPAAGVTYDQLTVPGFLLVFSDGKQNYEIHTSLTPNPGDTMVFCDNKKPVDLTKSSAPPEPSDATQKAMIELAKKDMAKTLGVDIAIIKLVGISPVEWNDSSIGCPKPGVNYMQVITPGFLIRLDANGTVYEYHTDSRSNVVQCSR